MSRNLKLKKLLKPLPFKLGVEDKTGYALFQTLQDFASGENQLSSRPFYVSPVTEYDVILGTPFLRDARVLVGNNILIHQDSGADAGERIFSAESLPPIPLVSALDVDPAFCSDEELLALGYTQDAMLLLKLRSACSLLMLNCFPFLLQIWTMMI